MTLENIYYIGQTIAVLAILASLIFLAFQGRQTQKQIEQANVIAQTQLSKSSTDYFLTMLERFRETEEDCAFMDRAFYTMEPLNDYEQDLFHLRMNALVSTGLASRELADKGMMSDFTYKAGENFMRSIMAWPRPQKWWHVSRVNSPQNPYVIDFDNLVAEAAELPKITPRDLFDVNNPLTVDAQTTVDEANS